MRRILKISRVLALNNPMAEAEEEEEEEEEKEDNEEGMRRKMRRIINSSQVRVLILNNPPCPVEYSAVYALNVL